MADRILVVAGSRRYRLIVRRPVIKNLVDQLGVEIYRD